MFSALTLSEGKPGDAIRVVIASVLFWRMSRGSRLGYFSPSPGILKFVGVLKEEMDFSVGRDGGRRLEGISGWSVGPMISPAGGVIDLLTLRDDDGEL